VVHAVDQRRQQFGSCFYAFVLRISMDCRVKPGNDDPDYRR
jgi:hypothetical protein